MHTGITHMGKTVELNGELVEVKEVPFRRKSEKWHEKERAKPLTPSDSNRKRKRYCITVPSGTMSLARKIGHGNASKGIEMAVDFWIDKTGERKRGPKKKKRTPKRGSRKS